MRTAEILAIVIPIIYIGLGIIFLKVSNRISRDKGEREYPNPILTVVFWFPLFLVIAFVYLEGVDFKRLFLAIKKLWTKFPYKKTLGVTILCPFLIFLFLVSVFLLTFNLKILQYSFVIAMILAVAAVSVVHNKEYEAYQRTKRGTA